MKTIILPAFLICISVSSYSQKDLLCGFKNGLQEGTCKTFYDNGQVKESVEWEKGKPHGDAHYYHKNGRQEATGKFYKGFKTGKWLHYYDNGTLSAEESFKVVDNTESKEGLFTYYYPNGKKKYFVNFKKNLREGEAHNYFENGYINQKFSYTNGVMTGEAEIFHETTGKLEGKGTLKAGEKDGKWTYYYDDGITVEEIGHYVNGVQEGEWKSYHKNGKQKAQSTFIKGKREGKRLLFDEKGNLEKTEMYKNGELIK